MEQETAEPNKRLSTFATMKHTLLLHGFTSSICTLTGLKL